MVNAADNDQPQQQGVPTPQQVEQPQQQPPQEDDRTQASKIWNDQVKPVVQEVGSTVAEESKKLGSKLNKWRKKVL